MKARLEVSRSVGVGYINKKRKMRLTKEVLVLDGGFSNELNKYVSFNVHEEPLWTARALFEETDAIIKTHEAYLNGLFF